MNKKSKILSLVAGVIAFGVAAQAADQATLDLLQKKGFITESEAKEVSSKGSAPIVTKSKNVKKLTVSGQFQYQWDHMSTDRAANDPVDENEMGFRRARLGAKADLVKDVSAVVNTEWADADAALEVAYAQYTGIEDHTIQAGLRKAPLGYNYNISSASLKTIEDDAATTRLNPGYRNGLYLVGDNVQKSGFGYLAGIFRNAAANGSDAARDNTLVTTATANNDYSYAAGVNYAGKADALSYKVGATGALLTKESAATGDDTLYNVYGDFSYESFNLIGEYYIRNVEAGATDRDYTGYSITPSYRFTKEWEAVVQYSQVDTDGANAIGTTRTRNAAALTSARDEQTQYYVGANYYVLGNDDIKVSAGYEFSEYESATAGVADEDSSGVRARVQVLF